MARTQFLLITGLSGSGKSLVHNVFEDMGYYCVDNLPVGLLERFCELTEESPEISRVAIVADVREKSFLTNFVQTYEELKARFRMKLIFLEASEDVLIQRFSETRRPHPMAHDAPLAKSVHLEREKLMPVRELADHIIDTSRFNVHEVRDYIKKKFGAETSEGSLLVSVVSFGFKHGSPRDADLLFDVRFLPNPHFVPEFRGKTGLEPEVRDYVLGNAETQELLQHLLGFLRYLLPRFIREGKAYLTVAIGCTGGKHRSVALANEVTERLKDSRYSISVTHRDLDRP
jgi:UPF0042 nucleotide-binding protein